MKKTFRRVALCTALVCATLTAASCSDGRQSEKADGDGSDKSELTNKDGELAIFVDCGYQDFFYDVNMVLHEKLLKQGVGHDFLTRPGAHTAEYWAASLPHQLLFFRAYFDGEASK